MRKHSGDPLIVRAGAIMVPTPRAEELIESVRLILSIATNGFRGRARFDPLTSDPCVSGEFSLEQFTSEEDVVAAIAGTGHVHLEPGFGKVETGRKVALEVSSYFALAP